MVPYPNRKAYSNLLSSIHSPFNLPFVLPHILILEHQILRVDKNNRFAKPLLNLDKIDRILKLAWHRCHAIMLPIGLECDVSSTRLFLIRLDLRAILFGNRSSPYLEGVRNSLEGYSLNSYKKNRSQTSNEPVLLWDRRKVWDDILSVSCVYYILVQASFCVMPSLRCAMISYEGRMHRSILLLCGECSFRRN